MLGFCAAWRGARRVSVAASGAVRIGRTRLYVPPASGAPWPNAAERSVACAGARGSAKQQWSAWQLALSTACGAGLVWLSSDGRQAAMEAAEKGGLGVDETRAAIYDRLLRFSPVVTAAVLPWTCNRRDDGCTAVSFEVQTRVGARVFALPCSWRRPPSAVALLRLRLPALCVCGESGCTKQRSLPDVDGRDDGAVSANGCGQRDGIGGALSECGSLGLGQGGIFHRAPPPPLARRPRGCAGADTSNLKPKSKRSGQLCCAQTLRGL